MRTGGPAFPRPAGWNGLNGLDEYRGNDEEGGMTLRDYFAAQFMVRAQNLCQNTIDGEWSADAVADCAYMMADAMLKAREDDRKQKKDSKVTTLPGVVG